MAEYELIKWMHIIGSTVLFGTGAGTAFQMVAAMRGQDPSVIGAVAKNVVLADWIFTTPAGVLQPVTGVTLVYLTGVSLLEPWLVLVYALYLVAFLAWAPVVWLQHQIRDSALEAASKGLPLPEKCLRYYRIWFTLGWPAFIALMAIFWLMISRPQF